jgi:hypothetical protein
MQRDDRLKMLQGGHRLCAGWRPLARNLLVMISNEQELPTVASQPKAATQYPQGTA